MNISFKNIDIIGNVIKENNLYKHYHYPEMLNRYSSNFIAFKKMPTLHEFVGTEQFLRDFHLKHGQHHVEFVFPQDKKPTTELDEYLNKQEYSIAKNELYTIEPSKFPEARSIKDILVEQVGMETLKDYLLLQYEQDLKYGENFAKEKQNLLKRNYDSGIVIQIIAYYKGSPAGAVDVILTEGIVEIDNLFVKEPFQRKGIGSQLQRFVMDSYKDNKVILVADGDDTPREMYQRQNYKYVGFQYEALKVYEKE
ncbi:GNAT family N-acetyltransferase [Paucisalibacillus sp. EB02]|uniref:GNAT family N-acetyltransferase n=1 Tax=Paucisalibacillus sp. EB02 TaxID=1347087 RepID=UPI0004BC4CCC|nr:GNAT family N-acetyltransferase [Paucisalibacillus sp. EB02]